MFSTETSVTHMDSKKGAYRMLSYDYEREPVCRNAPVLRFPFYFIAMKTDIKEVLFVFLFEKIVPGDSIWED